MKGDRPTAERDAGVKCRRRRTDEPLGSEPAWPGDPEHMEASEVDFEALAHILANPCRWGGGTRHFLSLARHVLSVSEEIEAHQGVPLLDDIAVEDRRALALHALPVGARAIRPMASVQAAERWLARVHELPAGDGHDGGATAVPAAGAHTP